MLQRLAVHNLALIRDVEIEFTSELNVFTGETGAGKSIIVDSLMLLVGCRYDKSMLKFGADSGFVEGVFSYADGEPLAAIGLDADDGIFVVTRKFFRDGRNDIRINGKSVTTSMLREFMQNYADIYGQNEYQSLLKVSEQKKILDGFVFGKQSKPLARQRALYDEYKKIVKELAEIGDETERSRRIDILKYQIDEIEAAAVERDEEERLLARRHILMSAERIKTALSECFNVLDGDGGAMESVDGAMRSLSVISALGDNFSSLFDRLDSVSIELGDIAECVSSELETMEGGERELDEVVARLDKLRALKSKYGNYDAMCKYLADAKLELDNATFGAERYDKLCAARDEKERELYESCTELSVARAEGAARMSEKILGELADLGMANSAFEVRFAPRPDKDGFTDKVTPVGFDECEFYLSPNVGQPLLPLAKIISGGEMSRFMLAIKLVIGDLGGVETMIFDEIDTGISGTTGLCVAKKLAALSRGHQVLCVTHLPQIAAMADGHYYIEKFETDGDTVTRVTALDRAGMIDEISRLSGTKGVSDSSVKNAAELKKYGDEFKSHSGRE